MIDDSILKLTFKKDDFILKADQNLFQNFDDIEKKIFNEVKKQINKFNTEGGKISFDDKNVDLVNEIDGIIAKAIKNSDYPKNVNDFLRSFETIKEFNTDIHKNVNDLSDKELNDLINPIQKQTVENTLQGLTGSGVNTNFIEPVRQGIYQNIVAGSSITDLEKYLTNYIISNAEKLGQFKKYAGQISRDALNQFDGQVNSRIAEDFGLDAFEYVGSLIEDSRPQCRRWVAKGTLLKSDLENEISWANNNGTGMIPGTNSENFAIYRGGYNCRHSAIPFKLTKSERERLGIEQEKQIDKETKTIDAQIKEVKLKSETKTEELKKAEKKSTLNPNLFLTTQKEKTQNDFLQVIEFTNDLSKISNEKGINISLRSPSECSLPGTRKFLQKTNPKLTPFSVGTVGKENGNCSTNNTFINIKIKNDEKIVFEKYDMNIKNLESIQGITKREIDGVTYYVNSDRAVIAKTNKGGELKYWTVSSVSKQKNKNIAPTITHEGAHAIQFQFDKNLQKFNDLFKKNNLKLTDCPSLYGETNKFEFWTESFTNYVYDNEGLKKRNPKIFDFVEDYLKEMNVDLKTIKIAE